MDTVIGLISHTQLFLSCTEHTKTLTVLTLASLKSGACGRDRKRQRNPKQCQASRHLSECMKHGRKVAYRSGNAAQLWRAQCLHTAASASEIRCFLRHRESFPKWLRLISYLTFHLVQAACWNATKWSCIYSTFLTPFIHAVMIWWYFLMFNCPV